MAPLGSIGIVAPSSVVPQSELELGVQRLRSEGFRVHVHPQCRKKHLFFAGKDEVRAEAFYDHAIDPAFSVLWCARGGYGANHLLRHLENLTATRGIPAQKLLIGASDATALLEFVRTRWNWSVLHAPMPGLRNFQLLAPHEWKATLGWVQGQEPKSPFGPRKKLRFFGTKPSEPIRGTMIGGNLTVWTALQGTPYAPVGRDRILFFEDVTETLPRIDRMVQQLSDTGAFDRVRALVLGNFLHCEDAVPTGLIQVPKGRSAARVLRSPKPSELAPLRPKLAQLQGLREIFGAVERRFGIPVAYGLPVGHGPEHSPLPLGAEYELSPSGGLALLRWGWLRG